MLHRAFMANTVPHLDVAIVGGGPAGLAAGLALLSASPQLRVKVFERSPAREPCGAGLRLGDDGLKALAAVSPAAHASTLKSSVPRSGGTVQDPQGRVVRTIGNDSEGSDGRSEDPYALLGWWELTQCLQQELQPEVVVAGKTFDHAVVGEDGVDVFFQGEGRPVTAKVLLGCDGYYSKISQEILCLPPATFQELILWRARVPKASLPASVLSDELQPTFYLGGGLMGVVYPVSCGDVVWTVSAPTAELEAKDLGQVVKHYRSQGRQGKEYGGAQRIQHCLRMVENYPALLLDCIAATDPGSIVEHGLWTRDSEDIPDDRLGDGPVTVLGDAFHPMRPTGQGVSSALEDAVVLAKCIAEQGPCAAALRAYERERIPRVKPIVAAALVTARAAYTKDAATKVEAK